MPAERQSPEDVVVSDAGAWAAGSVISGKFEVLRVLGQGAMGVVVAARHLELDEIVAIKFIHPEMHSVPDIVSRFAREAKACARLGSEHIAKVMDVGVAPAIGPYIVMEYLEGQDLGSLLLRKRGALPVHRACEYVMQVCEALALAHAAGIIHRDVKPENLFLTRRGNLDIIKVLDFGISKAPLGGARVRRRAARHRDRVLDGDAAVHVARADPRHARGRSPLGHLVAGRGAVRASDRTDRVRGRDA